MFYYYPLSSKDFTFENIFSSESVSPPFFYKSRGFGIDYFYVIPAINYQDAIILYSNPPIYEVGDNIKFILQIEESCLNLENIILISKGVFAYQKTIYLDKNNFKLIFFSEKDKKISMLKAATSLPTKSIEKYLNNFLIISELECVKYDFNNQIYNVNTFTGDILMKEDKKYNQFKGLVYGIATGLYNYKPKEEIRFKKLIREIVNSFAELKSRLADSKSSYSKSNDRKKDNSDRQTQISRLLGLIQLAQQSYYDLFIDLNLDEDILAKILHEQIRLITSEEHAKQFIELLKIEDEAFGTTRFEELKKKYSRYNTSINQNISIERLKSQINRFIEETISNTKSKIDLGELNDDIKITLYEIDRIASKIARDKFKNEFFSIDGLAYDFDKNEIAIVDNFQSLTDNELTDMILINNVILKFSEKNKSLSRKDEILQIVKEVGNLFSKGTKETLLYQYLNNEADTYAFEKITSAVMKNFVAFIFNVESIEKLENFINTNNIEKDWMAYSFWGSFNGFANLSGNFTKSIFSKDGETIQVHLDAYFKKYVDILKNLNMGDNPKHYVEEKEPDYIVPLTIDVIKSFYLKFVFGKYNISMEEFSSIVSIRDKDVFCKEVKLKFKMNKKNAEKLFTSIKRDFDSPLLFN